ncbi:MAG: glycosyl hydrolase [Gammaproteobacteria bacterium]|nr:glycosyl hydrolase [Gammaproteobacteria bacterium]
MRYLPARLLGAVLLSGVVAMHPVPAEAKEKPKSELGALEFRAVGPAISGRATRVAGVPGDPLTYYVAFAQGGIWKSENAGRDWKPVFDDQPTNSIGSLAIAPSDPNVIYAGGGEANIRGNVAWGTGIFKSSDAGKSWQQVWKTRGQIGTMAVDPRNPDIAFAAVLGSPFGPNKDRGVYRTTDGGKTWKQVLFKDDRTGASDVALDPNNPRIVFAGLWQTQRQPWVMTSGGPGSGLYRSTDGGDTWEQVKENGLPGGEWGKVGVRVAPSNSNIVYALIEAKDGGLYRSSDGGENWELASDHRSLRQRAWYYTCLTIDPTNPDIVWFPQVPLLRTMDGGRTIVSVDAKIHGDHHDIWIDPRDPRRMMSGNDGGIGISIDGGATWDWPAMPTPQFYNIDVDDRWPYHVGGTIQDWGTASGPAFTLRRGGDEGGSGPNLGDFYAVGGGEAGDFVYDRGAPGTIYAGEYGGYISYYQEGSGNFRNVGIYPYDASGTPPKELKYRFQWTAPIAASPHDPKVLYHGANVLFRTTDRGATWQAISPDLTRDDKSKQQWSGGPITGDITGVETYDTIFSIAESPVTAGQIWVGTDDGLVHLTRDGGKSWTNVTPKKLPEWGTVEAIEPSRRDAGTAYVVVDARRLNDPRPYLFRTRDYGASWEQLGKGLPDDQHLFVVREDPTNADLLYVGAERGLFMSRDGGASFFDIRNNLPAVGVADIEVRHDDLVLGTRRGIWILDDITALRAFDPSVKSEPVHLFPSRKAYRARLEARWDSLVDKVSSNAPYGMNVTYWLKDEPPKGPEGTKPSPDDPNELRLEIYDAQGTLVRTLSSVPKPDRYRKDDPDEPKEPNKPALTKKQGLNRVQWDLRAEGAKRPPDAKVDAGDPEQGPLVLPGKYTLKLKYAGQTYTTTGEVAADPRSTVSADELRANYEFARRAGAAIDRLEHDIETVRAVRAQAETISKLTAKNAAATGLHTAADAVVKRCDEIERRMHNPDAQVVYDVLAGREGGAKLYSQLSSLYSSIGDSDYPPTQGQREQLEANLQALSAIESELQGIRSGELAKLEAQASALGTPHVIVPEGG